MRDLTLRDLETVKVNLSDFKSDKLENAIKYMESFPSVMEIKGERGVSAVLIHAMDFDQFRSRLAKYL